MDIEIRQAINDRLEELNLTRSEWARQLGKQRQHVTELLEGRRGFVPPMILEALDSVGLELKVVKKDAK